MADNPLAHLSGGNVKADRRHDRLPLSAAQLRAVIEAAAASARTFRGLTGKERAILYATAAGTGFRTSELASLTPGAFDLPSMPPTATLAAADAKNGRQAVQPLPPVLAAILGDFLAGNPAGLPVWPGTWHHRAADMLRLDLDAAAIGYTVEGADGPRFRDFHCLRHTFISLLDKSGATLKEAMQLARHSDPKLTMAVYGRAQLHDLGEAVGRLPAMLSGPKAERQALRATGTDGAPGPRLDQNDEISGDSVRGNETNAREDRSKLPFRNLIAVTGVESAGDPVRGGEISASCRTRTYNPLIKRRTRRPLPLSTKPSNSCGFITFWPALQAFASGLECLQETAEFPQQTRGSEFYCGIFRATGRGAWAGRRVRFSGRITPGRCEGKARDRYSNCWCPACNHRSIKDSAGGMLYTLNLYADLLRNDVVHFFDAEPLERWLEDNFGDWPQPAVFARALLGLAGASASDVATIEQELKRKYGR
jgi:hypothetical protein